jgi:hypothetical protein
VSREHQWEVKQGTCCTTELGSVAAILSSSGEATLAAHLLAPMTAEEAAAFAGELEGYATSLVDGNAGEPEDEEGWKFLRDCETLLAAASWFGKLGEAGFGVVAGRSPGRTYPRSSKRRAA